MYPRCRYEPRSGAEQRSARQLLAAAHSSRLLLSGRNFLGPAVSQSSRFTAPERLALLPEVPGSKGQQEGAEASSASPHAPHAGAGAAHAATPVSISTGGTVARGGNLGSGRGISVRSLAAGADFAVLLTWDGLVFDTRCLAAAAAASGGQPPSSQGRLDWSGLWCPPCCKAVRVAAGGCWQGELALSHHTPAVPIHASTDASNVHSSRWGISFEEK